jgi:hypothetical protein
MAQKPHKPTDDLRRQIEQASGLGLPHDQIAALVGISDETLRKYYGPELAVGKAKASAQVAKTLFNKAVQGGDTTAMIWWTKAQMRWSETVKQELTGQDGAPLLSGIQVSFVKNDAEA